LVNFNAVRFRIQARTQGGVEVAAVPALPNLRIDNRLQRGAGACGGFQNGVVFAVRDDTRRDNAVLEGRFPAACREYELSRTVLQPESYAWGLFDLQWRQQGGELKGGWRVGVLPTDIGTPFHVQIDGRNLLDIQVYVNGVNVLPATVFKLDKATGPLKALFHFEKSANDSLCDVLLSKLEVRLTADVEA
jgi:hypothetical protein